VHAKRVAGGHSCDHATVRRRTTNFELELGTASESEANSLIDWLRTSGTKLEIGENVQYASAIFQVRARGGGTLALFEPQPGSLPIVWIDSVQDSLATLARQRELATRLGLVDELDFAHPMTSGYLCTRAAPGVRVGMVREAQWAVMCLDKTHDHRALDEVEPMSLYEICVRLPEARWYLGLPVKTAVLIGGGKPAEVFFDKKRRDLAPPT